MPTGEIFGLSSPFLQALIAALLGLLLSYPLGILIRRLPLAMERAWKEEGLPEQSAFPVARIPHRDLLSALLSALLFGLCALCLGVGLPLLAAMLFCWLLLAMSFIDWERQLLPDVLSLGLLWAGLLINTTALFAPLASAIWGAAAGYLTLWLCARLFLLVTGREGMGYGDCKLLAALGAWLGWQFLPAIILIASLGGVLVGGTMILARRRKRREPMPFGPYLALAGVLMLLWGREICAFTPLFLAC